MRKEMVLLASVAALFLSAQVSAKELPDAVVAKITGMTGVSHAVDARMKKRNIHTVDYSNGAGEMFLSVTLFASTAAFDEARELELQSGATDVPGIANGAFLSKMTGICGKNLTTALCVQPNMVYWLDKKPLTDDQLKALLQAAL